MPETDDTVVDTAVEQENQTPEYLTKDDLDKFSDKLTSHFGRIVAQQLEKKEPVIDQDKLNAQLQNRILGDVSGTVNDIIDAREKEQLSLENEKKAAVLQEMAKYQDKPYYQEVKDDLEKIAHEALGNKFPPGPATELAYEKACKNLLLHKDPDYKLGMAGAGKKLKRSKKKELPKEFKAAAKRDIDSGLFKDEADYMENLSPQVKANYGL